MYKATGNILHNDQKFAAGDTVPVSPEEAKSLIEAGVLEEVAEAKEPEDPKKTKSPDASKKPEKKEVASNDKPNEKWSREKAAKYATEHGIAFSEEATKKEIIEAIQKAEAEVAPSGAGEAKEPEAPVVTGGTEDQQ